MIRVFRRFEYVLLALAIALGVHIVMVIAQFPAFIHTILFNSSLIASEKGYILLTLFKPVIDSGESFLFTLLLPLLFGINSALLIFYIRFFKTAPSSLSLGGGIMGSISAFLGIGCAACGSVFLSALTSTLGASGLLALLPFHGKEVGYAGLLFLLISSTLLARSISKPPVCPV